MVRTDIIPNHLRSVHGFRKGTPRPDLVFSSPVKRTGSRYILGTEKTTMGDETAMDNAMSGATTHGKDFLDELYDATTRKGKFFSSCTTRCEAAYASRVIESVSPCLRKACRNKVFGSNISSSAEEEIHCLAVLIHRSI
jgi:hypothetical protein